MTKAMRLLDSRRGFIRVAPKKEFPVVVGSQRFRGLDISVYGLSFLVPRESETARSMTEGSHIQDLCFELDGRELYVGARIKHLQPLPGRKPGGIRVGVEFVDIKPEDVWFLSGYTVKLGVPKPARLKVNLKELLKGPKKRAKKRRATPKAKVKTKAKAKAKAKVKAKSKPRSRKRRRTR